MKKVFTLTLLILLCGCIASEVPETTTTSTTSSTIPVKPSGEEYYEQARPRGNISSNQPFYDKDLASKIQKDAIENRDLIKCKLIENRNRYITVVDNTSGEKTKKLISDNSNRNQCFFNYAIETNDVTVCDMIEKSENFKFTTYVECIKTIGYRLKDAGLCEKIFDHSKQVGYEDEVLTKQFYDYCTRNVGGYVK